MCSCKVREVFNRKMRYLVIIFICLLAIVTAYQSVDDNESYSNISVTESSFSFPDKLTNSTRLLPPTSHRRANVRKRKTKKKNCDTPIIPQRRNAYDVDEARMTVPQIIQKYDYPSEVYTVPTKDGYVLTLHRIPWGVRSPYVTTRPVIFLMHGIFASSSDFIINGPELSLAYILADAGFDVWMGNARGNTYSRNHNTMVPANQAFWDFSFHEIGIYDLPAMIDFIINMTGLPGIFYLGHSQGTTSFYIMLSELPQYNQYIIASVSLAPVAYMTHITSPFFRLFATFADSIGLFTDLIGLGELRLSDEIVSSLGHLVCKDSDFTQFLCTAPMFLIGGVHRENFNISRIPLYMGHSPDGSSSRQLVHYGQLHLSGKFRYFDNGLIENLAVYGSMYPPDYKIPNVKVPVILIYTTNDWLAHITDIDRLDSELPNSKKYPIPDPRFTHYDFIYGLNVRELVYDPLLIMLNEYVVTRPECTKKKGT